ncbi:CDP-glycerol glycerophosphotransferase family protein [Specibacter sp. NPDC057265]|uniref:bifunctional glycosyltransferase/CDP-glycerol:glycerophosphate glycerophosphotransferase n=1 Tax=Specibacter sp. NPDC057265 TaxID=3346075 RepID=UPI0036392B94
MRSTRTRMAALVPARVKSKLRTAIHPAQRQVLARAAGKRAANLGTLSVVIPVFNVENYLAACLDSVISQSYPHLDIIVVDDGSNDGSMAIAQQYARWDKRIRIISLEHGGNGRARNVAIDNAWGDFLTFADSDDVVAVNAYQTMMHKITASGSDFVVGSSDRLIGKKKVSTKQAARLHATERIAISLEEFPAILDDVFLWNKLFRKTFWDLSVAPIPEGILYEDQETTARAFLRARAFDVLAENVYSWRQRPGSSSITQGKGELKNLQDRLTVAAEVSDLILNEGPDESAQVWYLRLFGSDLVPYFDLVANRGDDYWEALSSAVQRIYLKFQSRGLISAQTMQRMDPHARVFLELARLGLRDQVEEVIVDRIDSGHGYEVRLDKNRIVAVPNYWRHINQAMNMAPLECAPELLTFDSGIRWRDHQDGHGQFLEGYAYLRGLDIQGLTFHTRCTFNFIDGSKHGAQLHPRINNEIDVLAGDPYASHASSGFRVASLQDLGDSKVESVQIELKIEGTNFSSLHQMPKNPTMQSAKVIPYVVAFTTSPAEDAFEVTMDWGDHSETAGVFLSTRRTLIRPSSSTRLDNARIRYTFKLNHRSWGQDVFSYSSGAYTLRFQKNGSPPVSIGASSDVVLVTPLHQRLRHANVTAWVTEAGKFAVTIAAPLSEMERSKYHQRRMQQHFQKDRKTENHVVIESFSGTFATDSPRALADEFHKFHPEVPFYFSVVDHSVPIPNYGIALIRNTEQWYQKVSTAKLLINNNNFPFYFRKDVAQVYLQTWHGTPLKTIGSDTPRTYTSPSYRRVLANESVQWSAMVAQSEYASDIFKKSFNFNGDMIIQGYPRNDALFNNLESRNKLRSALGIGKQDIAVLLAPTWRDDVYLGGSNVGEHDLDIGKLTALIGKNFKFLVRSHHNSDAVMGSKLNESIINVTGWPEINDLILASDCLVTDYSSIIFDYSTTGKPIFGYIPDIGKYENMRGTYIDARQIFGGNHSESLVELSKLISEMSRMADDADGSYHVKNTYAPLDDGRASGRVLQALCRVISNV